MPEWFDRALEFVDRPGVITGVKVAVTAILGLVAFRFLSRRLSWRRLDAQQLMLARRISSWGVLIAAILTILGELGIGLGPLIGAAGLLTVALGFASQTSMSNVISGLFLIGERPFSVGDLVQVGTTMGYVTSIEMLAVKLRTVDNLMVRIPNETMLRSEMTNFTHFPIRRVDLLFNVSVQEDLDDVQARLRGIAAEAGPALAEPEPVFMLKSLSASAVELQFSVWCLKDEVVALRTELYKRITRELAHNGVDLAVPTMLIRQARDGGEKSSNLSGATRA